MIALPAIYQITRPTQASPPPIHLLQADPLDRVGLPSSTLLTVLVIPAIYIALRDDRPAADDQGAPPAEPPPAAAV